MIFAHAFDLHDELVHQPKVARVLLTKVLFANLSGLLLTVFRSKGHAIDGTGHRTVVERRS